MPRPNLFVIGAMKSGTSSLHDYLGTHPGIYMSSVKEPCHFVPELGRSQGLEWYLSLFAEGGECTYRGESSVVYTHLPDHPGVPERIDAFSPDARYIFIMRDPVERAVSHYWHRLKSKRVVERRDMESAFRENPVYFNYSDYAMQLRPYLDRFGADRVLSLTLEELSADTVRVMGSIYAWLGVAVDAVPEQGFQTVRHVTPKVITQKIGWLSRLRYSAAWNAMGPWVPAGLRKLGKRLSEPVTIDRASVPVDAAVEFAREQLRPRIEALRELLGRDFPEWKTLYRSDAAAVSTPAVAARSITDREPTH
ncbi:MAG: sulfotransferase [Planctomycetaceae bacterium]|nr:MAG: sulfotransferase [Planctomycetaceae bacterium]